MARGIFQGTFYCPEGPQVVLDNMVFDLNPSLCCLSEQLLG